LLSAVPALGWDDNLARLTLAAVLGSLSYAGAALGPAALDAVVSDALALARAAGGARFRRDLTLRWAARRRPRRGRRPA